jgi:hypothetical protein
MTFVGLDLHKHNVTACALDAGGAVLAEAKRLPVTLEALGPFLARPPLSAPVACEGRRGSSVATCTGCSKTAGATRRGTSNTLGLARRRGARSNAWVPWRSGTAPRPR